MLVNRPYVLTIAGFDPSGGAGLTADIKTFEQNKVLGLSICTGLTVQTERKFDSVSWRKLSAVKKELKFILSNYDVKSVKFGIVPSFKWLEKLISIIHKKDKKIKIIVDPVIKSSTGFEFLKKIEASQIRDSFQKCVLITPNLEELKQLAGKQTPTEFLKINSGLYPILVKGGHDKKNKGVDTLYEAKSTVKILPGKLKTHSKHGSGCVLSAAITANLAKGYSLIESCKKAKKYTENFLASNSTLLGYHAS